MIARIVIILLIVVLALPVAMLTRPTGTSPSSWGTVDAKGKKQKKHKTAKPPQVTTVTRTVRQSVTQTFADPARNEIPNAVDPVPASRYPSAIVVSGFSNGTITDVNLILSDFTHTAPFDVDVLLSTNDGRRALVMSDVGDATDVANVDLTLDDEAAAALPVPAALTSGTFRPTNNDVGALPDLFAGPAPAANGSVALSTFDGGEPNGTWRLWVMDNGNGDGGEIGGGWALEITAEVDVPVEVVEDVEEPVKTKPHKKKSKKRH